MPLGVYTPPMVTDVDERWWLDWTGQPGEPGQLHVRALGPGILDEQAQRAEQAAQADLLPIRDSSLLPLRPYQRDAVESVQRSWHSGHRAPLVVIATGGGKTVIASALARAFKEARGARTLFLAHRKELLVQTQEKIRMAGGDLTTGLVQASRNEVGPHIDVTIASVQTLGGKDGRRLDQVLNAGRFDLLILDEAHHAVSPQWLRVIQSVRATNPDVRVMGMTATPGRSDGVALDLVFDTVCYERNSFDLIRDGYLVPPKGFRVNIDLDLDRVRTEGGDYSSSQLSKLLNQPRVHEAIVHSWMQFGHNRKTIVFAVDVEHAVALASFFNDAGYAAEVVHGKTKAKDRTAIYSRFSEGATKLLVSCEVLTEGFDEPSIECVLFARPTQSQGLYIQCLDEKTEVLTSAGWKGIGDSLENVQLAAFDVENEDWRWSPVLSRTERELGDEPMFGIESPHMSLRVTAGHQMVVKPRKGSSFSFRSADSIPSESKVPVSCVKRDDTDCALIADCELMFIGYLLTDGNLNRKNNQITISQSDKYPEVVRRIESCIRDCGFKFGYSRKSGASNFKRNYQMNKWWISKGKPRGRDKHLTGWDRLSDWIGHDGKSLTERFDLLSSRQVGVLMSAVLDGNGAKFQPEDYERHSFSVSTANHRLGSQLQSLLVRSGYRCNARFDSTICMLHGSPDREWSMVTRSSDGRPTWSVVDSIASERVWCVESETGAIFVRRNGKVSIVGNCMGRGLRPWPGKTECLVIDCVGNSEKHQPVQLASLAGFDPNLAVSDGAERRANGEQPEEDEEELPEVREARIRGEAFEISRRPSKTRYQWRETDIGWVLQIPRIGYYLCSWSDRARHKCVISFFDQRPKRRHLPAREVVRDPIDFELAYGMVEGEMDRFFNARRQRDLYSWRGDHAEFADDDDGAHLESLSFIDVTDGVEDDLEIEEAALLESASWRKLPMSKKQRTYLLNLGAKEATLPETMGEASDMILILQVERDRKMRVPATEKQLAFLRVNRIAVKESQHPLTKGEAARLIVDFRRRNG
jgi:superfamily II DNA or RNA helicase